jgi:hypothetical protein
MTRRKKWDSERMKAVIETMRNKEMSSYKASRVFNLPQTTLQSYDKDRQESSSEAIKQNWVGSKVFLKEKNDLAEHCLLMEGKFLGFTIANAMCLASQLAVRNGIKTFFAREMERLEGSGK